MLFLPMHLVHRFGLHFRLPVAKFYSIMLSVHMPTQPALQLTVHGNTKYVDSVSSVIHILVLMNFYPVFRFWLHSCHTKSHSKLLSVPMHTQPALLLTLSNSRIACLDSMSAETTLIVLETDEIHIKRCTIRSGVYFPVLLFSLSRFWSFRRWVLFCLNIWSLNILWYQYFTIFCQ